MNYTIDIRRSKRKSIGFEIKESGTLIVRAPYFLSDREIAERIETHHDWIETHMQILKEREEQERQKRSQIHKYTDDKIRNMAEQALKIIPPRVKQYAQIIGVTYGRITIRNQKTRWGSCSSKGNLNFNCLLMEVPEDVMDYVIVHELCHRIEMNHSECFWKLVEQTMPDYKSKKKWLKDHGHELISRMY